MRRREFCLGVGAAAGGALLSGSSGCRGTPELPAADLLPDADPPTSMTIQVFGSGSATVVEARWAAAVDRRGRVTGTKVKTLLDAAVERLTQSASPWSAWADAQRSVSIKVNTIDCQAFSHPELAAAAARGVVSAGAKSSLVTVWDRDTSGLTGRGYTIDKSGAQLGYRCLATEGAGDNKSPQGAAIAGTKVYFSKLLTEADLLINIAALKDHSMAGVSLSLKNNFGMIWGADRLHGKFLQGSGCEPGISQLAARPEIKDKLQICIIDALVGICEGGPGPAKHEHAFRYGGVLVSRDPVALDRRGRAIIETRRQKLNLVPLAQRTKPNPSPTKHIENAAALGVSPG